MNIHVKPPEGPQDALYLPTDISPEKLFQAIGRLRREARDEIDRLLAFLDETDGDADLEPSLSFPEPHRVGLTESHHGGTDDREDDTDLESTGQDDDEEGHDAEPALGSTDSVWQGAWSAGENDDREDEHDGREPSLSGVTVEVTYNDRDLESDGNCDYEEDDPAELSEVSGIGDWDGMLEQIGGHHSYHGRVID